MFDFCWQQCLPIVERNTTINACTYFGLIILIVEFHFWHFERFLHCTMLRRQWLSRAIALIEMLHYLHCHFFRNATDRIDLSLSLSLALVHTHFFVVFWLWFEVNVHESRVLPSDVSSHGTHSCKRFWTDGAHSWSNAFMCDSNMLFKFFGLVEPLLTLVAFVG